MEDEYRRILEQSKASGSHRFSMDVDRALETMSRYQLQDANTYILKLVQWAVRSQPRRIDVRISGPEVVVAHDGEVVAADGFGDLLAQTAGRASFHLLVGLCAALRLGAKQILLHRPEGPVAFLGDLDQAAAKPRLPQAIVLRGLKPKLSLPQPLTILKLALAPVVDAAPEGTWQVLRDLPMLARPECALVRYRCVYSGIPLLLNGRVVNHPFFGFMARHYITDAGVDIIPQARPDRVRYLAESADTPETMPGPVLPPGSDLVPLPSLTIDGRAVSGCNTMAFHQFGGGKSAPTTQLTWVQDGVVLERLVNPPELPTGANVVATVGHLGVDFSQFHLIRDEKYSARVREVAALMLPP